MCVCNFKLKITIDPKSIFNDNVELQKKNKEKIMLTKGTMLCKINLCVVK